MIQPQSIVQNDYGYQLAFILEDGSANPVNLAGATLTLKVQSSQDPTSTDLTLSGAVIVDNALAGSCHYAVAQGDFPNPGTFLTSIVAVWSGTETLTWIGPQLIVMPALPMTMN